MHEISITLTHLNVRQSIAILLAKLITADIILAFVTIGSYFLIVVSENYTQLAALQTNIFLTIFTILGILKIITSAYIVLLWLNEYYEITPEAIIHRRGIIFKKTEKYSLSKIRALTIQDSFLGELSNYATLTLYDLRMNKYLDMYLIHNPDRYATVLQKLKPDLEMKTDSVKVPFTHRKQIVEEMAD